MFYNFLAATKPTYKKPCVNLKNCIYLLKIVRSNFYIFIVKTIFYYFLLPREKWK